MHLSEPERAPISWEDLALQRGTGLNVEVIELGEPEEQAFSLYQGMKFDL